MSNPIANPLTPFETPAALLPPPTELEFSTPESELPITISVPPRSVRAVTAKIERRVVGQPDPILPLED